MTGLPGAGTPAAAAGGAPPAAPARTLARAAGEGYSRAVAKEARRLKRAAVRSQGTSTSRAKRKALAQPAIQKPAPMPDPVGRAQIKAIALRLGLPLAGVWLIGALIAGVSQSTTTQSIALGLPATVTLVVAGLLLWALRYARKARGVHRILSQVDSAEDRQEALEKIDSSYKKQDHAAVFAKAQLLMQEDPKQALEVLERIDLSKVMAPVADEARAQRAMIHLLQGEVAQARPLADGIDLSRHQDAKTRAMMASVVAEAWARSGQAKKALETLDLYDPEEDEYEQLRPQLHRALCYAYAHSSNYKAMRRSLRKLLAEDVRLLGGFMMKRTHPMLQKEARKLVERSGQIKPRMQVVRRP